MAEAETRKPHNEPQLLADWRKTMNSYRYVSVQNLFFQASLQHTHITHNTQNTHTHIPCNEEAMSAPPEIIWSIV